MGLKKYFIVIQKRASTFFWHDECRTGYNCLNFYNDLHGEKNPTRQHSDLHDWLYDGPHRNIYAVPDIGWLVQ